MLEIGEKINMEFFLLLKLINYFLISRDLTGHFKNDDFLKGYTHKK